MQVFDEPTMRKLEQLTLVANRVRVGMLKGERKSRKKGSAVEFADYRNYVQGDDLRRLDWNIYARLERPFIKLLEEEEDLSVHLVVDASTSMDWPQLSNERNKFRYALRLAGALAYIGLTSGDHVTVALAGNETIKAWGPHRGRGSATKMLQFIEEASATGITDLNQSLRRWAIQAKRPGLLFLLSDLFSPNGYQKGLDDLLSRGFEVGIIHVLSQDEVDPEVSAEVRLIDVETKAQAEISLDAVTLALYRSRLEQWRQDIAMYCGRRQIRYIPVSTDLPWDRLVLRSLRRLGAVR